MIEVYSLNLDGVWFSVACAREQIVASSFGPTQKSVIAKILETIPFNMPFQVFHETSFFAKNSSYKFKKPL